VRDRLIDIVWHWQVGWLRRPEMDDENGYCYEEPDGDLVYIDNPRHRRSLRLCIWEEPGGLRYTSISKSPLPNPKFAR
jgi:hypothetical protein